MPSSTRCRPVRRRQIRVAAPVPEVAGMLRHAMAALPTRLAHKSTARGYVQLALAHWNSLLLLFTRPRDITGDGNNQARWPRRRSAVHISPTLGGWSSCQHSEPRVTPVAQPVPFVLSQNTYWRSRVEPPLAEPDWESRPLFGGRRRCGCAIQRRSANAPRQCADGGRCVIRARGAACRLAGFAGAAGIWPHAAPARLLALAAHQRRWFRHYRRG